MKRTGNPFVDTGLGTIAALAEKDNIKELEINDIKKVFNKDNIAYNNANLKCFTMVFGTNNLLYQTAYKPNNKDMYKDFLNILLNKINDENNRGKYLCEICGQYHDFDINDIWNNILTKYRYKNKEKKYIGRDFFPLVGSIGNDAQALPSATSSVNICPKCLFAVNYIPIGTMLMKGRLICVESTSEEMMVELLKDIVNENLARISSGNSDIYGKKEGDSEIYTRLLNIFEKLQKVKKYEQLPETTAIYLWLFSNSGTGPNCEIIEIPNKTLKFLWGAVRKSQDFKNDLINLIKHDKKGRMFECINNGEDYEGLYPKGKNKGVNTELYEYYQRKIVGRDYEALKFAKRIAIKILKGKDKKEILKWQKSDIFKDVKNRNIAKKIIFDLILNGDYDYDDYLTLFSKKDRYLSTDEYSAYRVIMYYLYNADNQESSFKEEYMNIEVKSRLTDKKIKAFAQLYFNYYVLDKEKGLGRGIERFKKDILDRIKDFDEFWLKDSFAKLAEIYECEEINLDYDGWCDFITDDDGNRRIYELLFQLRLAFANLYKEYKKEEAI